MNNIERTKIIGHYSLLITRYSLLGIQTPEFVIGPCRTMQLEVIDMVQQKKREKSDYDRRLSDCYFFNRFRPLWLFLKRKLHCKKSHLPLLL